MFALSFPLFSLSGVIYSKSHEEVLNNAGISAGEIGGCRDPGGVRRVSCGGGSVRCRLLNVVKWAFSRGLIWDRKPELSKVRGSVSEGAKRRMAMKDWLLAGGVI